MHIVLVYVHIKPEYIEPFKAAAIDNASHSYQEPGVARFDIVQQSDDPARFILIEVYRTPADAAKHKETAHYLRWRDAVADMMAEPRTGIRYANVYPGDQGW